LVRTIKADDTLVTNADHAANDLIIQGLRAAYPDDEILSEETGLDVPVKKGTNVPPGTNVPRWLVDPLDGTKAYARGTAGFSVMLGLVVAGRPVLGVVYDPMEDRLYEARRGGGAYHTQGGRREAVRVSRRTGPERAVITSTGFSAPLRAHLARTLGVRFLDPINSVGVKVGYLVRGAADLYVNNHGVHQWDTAGPLVILEEAGGRFGHWSGEPLSYPASGTFDHGGPTAATNGLGHDELLAALAAYKKP
jgi:3'-phosphoadenosine 5'-phosphosulfate (PAPS) 3'-phosphatase